MSIKFYISFFLAVILAPIVNGQPHISQSINSNWEFHQGELMEESNSPEQAKWTTVTLPHTWNATDVTDDEAGYYRGIGWYKRTLYLSAVEKGRKTFLHFEGVNQVAEVYINGKLAGKHTGGYSAFNIYIEPYLKNGPAGMIPNEIRVKVDNSFNENIPPLDADFTFFGGIYRDVYLVTAGMVHFDLNDYASPGIKVKTPVVNDNIASISVSGKIDLGSSSGKIFTLVTVVLDASGKIVAQSSSQVRSGSSGMIAFNQLQKISHPHLWSPGDPYLYRVESKLYDRNGSVLLDEEHSPLGLRWYSFDAAKGFYLNGHPLKLIGASRHQDFKNMGNALPDAIHERDMHLLKNMGANFVRIAHYPQDPAVLETCDRLGLLASVEIPVVNTITEKEEFYNNCKQMQVEMIRQNFNHPSVIIWAYMNEVLLRPKYQKNSKEQDQYFASITALAKQIETITHQEDTERYTMIPCHGDYNLYQRAGLTAVPQILGWNLYQGWYSPGFEGFNKFVDHYHEQMPDKPMMVTEYGADADIRIHSTNPERFDKSIEYQVEYHQFYLKNILNRPFIAGAAVWNLADFNSEQRKDATPHINTKGLMTGDRLPKDAYFFYQANLVKRPLVKIGSAGWLLRSGIANSNRTCAQEVYVFSNAPKVQLWQNGLLLATQEVKEGVTEFSVPFVDGENLLKASATINGVVYEDMISVAFRLLPAINYNNKWYTPDLNISLGDNRYFVDDKLAEVWQPEQPYQKGSWGYVGGQVFTMPKQVRQRFGSDKDIYGTNLDAVYQTQRTGIEAFKFDVPDGEYALTLGFAELEGKQTAPALAYNLGSVIPVEEPKQRTFDVSVNGRVMLKSFGTQNYLQPQREYTTTFKITVENNKGISVDFKPIVGETILNAVQLKKIY